MSPDFLEKYGFPLLVVLFFFWRWFSFRKVKGQVPSLIQQGAIVLDVRSRGEFAAGARPGSLNIPLDELAGSLSQLSVEKPVIVCCASGARSARAMALLKKQGFKSVLNAGPWQNTLG